jgi:hypothetical protein
VHPSIAGLDPPVMDPLAAGGGAGQPRRRGGGGGGRARVGKEPGVGRRRRGVGRVGSTSVEMQHPQDCATGRGACKMQQALQTPLE